MRDASSLAPLSWAAESFPFPFRENHQVGSDRPQKGFYCRKGSLSSAPPGIQSHISNSGETTLHVVYSDCKLWRKDLLCATISQWPQAAGTSPCTRPTERLLHPGLCESREDKQKAEPQELPRLFISNRTIQFEQSRQTVNQAAKHLFYPDVIFEI